MSPLQERNTRLYRASVSPREGTTVRELTLISSTIKSHPKHEPSGYITIPVCLSGERRPQISHRLHLINHGSSPIDQLILSRTRYNHAHLCSAHRWYGIGCLLKSQITRKRFSPIEHLWRLCVTKTRNWLSRRMKRNNPYHGLLGALNWKLGSFLEEAGTFSWTPQGDW